MAVDTVARALALGAGDAAGNSYTKSETDTLLSGKADLVKGTVPLSQIPPAAIEREVVVANDIARFALTTAEVQLGDTVKVTSTNKMYLVIDTDHLDGELGYQVYVAGKAAEAVADQNGDTIDTTYVKIVSGKQLSTEDYTTAEKNKLAGIAAEAEVNQNAFSNITIGTSTIAADAKTDTLTIIAGTNVTITADVANDAFTINATDTTYDEASYNQLGLVKSGSSMKTIDDSYQPCPIIEGVPYYSTLETPRKIERYGIKVEKNNSNPETRCTYMYDAVGFTPAGMQYNNDDIESSTFSYGSWADAFFVKNNYPVMCKYDGSEDYKLSPSNHAYKEDGETSSDISDTAYNGNAMSCFDCKIYIKMWEDNDFEYYAVSNYQLDEDYKDYPYIRADGTHADKLYYPMFKGSNVDSKLRSIAGTYPQNKTTTTTEVSLCSANGTDWQIGDWAHRTWLNVLLLLMGKNDNTQLVYGEGCTSGGSDNASINYGFPVNGSLMDKGQFYGYATAKSTTKAMKVFYIENWWGTRWDRCLGLWDATGTYKIKWTPTYSVSAPDEDCLVMSGVTIPANGYQKKMSNTYGRLCVTTGGSASTYTCDYHSTNNSATCLAIVGGFAWSGSAAGAWYVSVNNSPSFSVWSIGASPYLKQPQH